MNIIFCVISGVLMALFSPYFLKLLNVEETFLNKLILIIVISFSFFSIYLYQKVDIAGEAKTKYILSESINRILTNSSTLTTVNADHINDSNATRIAFMIDEMNAVNKPYYERFDAINAKMNAIMSDEDVFSQQIYTDKKQLDKSKIWLTKYSEYLNQTLVLSKELDQAQKAKFNSYSNIDSRFLSMIKVDFERGSSRSKELILKRYAASKEVLDKLTVVISLADKNFGKVIVVNNTISFQKEADNDLYNQNMTELIMALKKEEKATKDLLDAKDLALINLKQHVE